MFELETAISNWKSDLVEASMSSANVEELHSHLMELIADLKTRDLNDREAFYVATSRLGTSSELSREYCKVDTSSMAKVRLSWMLGGVVAFAIASSVIRVISSIVAATAIGVGFPPMLIGATAVLALVVAWSVLLYGCCNKNASFIRHIPKRASGWLCVFAVFGYLLSTAVSRVAFVPISQITAPQDFGVISLWLGFGGMIVHFAVFIACVVLMWRLDLGNNSKLTTT